MESITIENLIAVLEQEDKRCLLVGAVPRGRYLYQALPDRIACWTDRRYRFFQMYGLPVAAADEIPAAGIDLIIHADHRNIGWFEGIAAEKGLSELPQFRLECGDGEYADMERPPVKYTDEPYIESELRLVDPAELLGPDRLDIVARYLACREFMEGKPGVGVRVYRKIVYSINQAQERIRPMTTCAYFSDYGVKVGYDAFEDSFHKLIASMKEHGFLKNHFIPVSETGRPLNGRHRLAVAMALEEKVYIKRYEGFGEPFFRYTAEDLPALGFDQTEIALLIDTYEQLRKEVV